MEMTGTVDFRLESLCSGGETTRGNGGLTSSQGSGCGGSSCSGSCGFIRHALLLCFDGSQHFRCFLCGASLSLFDGFECRGSFGHLGHFGTQPCFSCTGERNGQHFFVVRDQSGGQKSTKLYPTLQ